MSGSLRENEGPSASWVLGICEAVGAVETWANPGIDCRAAGNLRWLDWTHASNLRRRFSDSFHRVTSQVDGKY
jgi:hypothetical protein